MNKNELIRLGLILGMGLIGIWGLEMLDRPRRTEVIVRENAGIGALLVAKLRRERDSLANLLAEARGEEPPEKALTPIRYSSSSDDSTQKINTSAENVPTTRSLELAGELRRTAEQNRLLGIDFYEHSLREKLPAASFSSARERAEVKARIEALRETNKARSDCNLGTPAACNKLELLANDNRLSPEQQEMVRRLMEKS